MIKSGDRVTLDYDRDRRGKVVQAGPEQSVVRWDGQRDDRIYMNKDLKRLVRRSQVKSK